MALDTFTWRPFHVAPISEGFRVVDTPYENGTFQRMYKGRKAKQWNLAFKTTYKELVEIRNFFNTHNDTSSWKFQWLDSWDNKVYTVCFADPSSQDWETEWRINGVFQITLKEVM